MAFVSNNAGNNANQSAGNGGKWEKAQAFLNIYVGGKDGSKKKLVGVPLRASIENEAQLMEWLKQDPANLEKLLHKLIIDFQPVKTTGFDLD